MVSLSISMVSSSCHNDTRTTLPVDLCVTQFFVRTFVDYE